MSIASEVAPPATEPVSIRLASALFEIQHAEPKQASRLVLRTVCALFVVLLIWAGFAKLDIVAVAQGRLVPKTYVKIVQPAEAGIVRQIMVEEGQAVEQGQVLVRLDATMNSADATATGTELAVAQLQLRRIEAELSAKPMKISSQDDPVLFSQVDSQRASHRQAFLDSLAQTTAAHQRAVKELAAANELVRKLEATLPSYERIAQAHEKLARDKLVGALQAEERRRDAIEQTQNLEAQRATMASLQATVAEQEQAIAQLKSNYSTELARLRVETTASVARLTQQQEKLTFQGGLLELRAPQAGLIKDLATTTVGAVVQPGTVLITLVPADEPLLAEVAIRNEDIGFVKPGKSVKLKLATYAFQKYGMIDGVVKTISADSDDGTRSDPSRERNDPELNFKAIVELRGQVLISNGRSLPLLAGMQVNAEIIEGKRTVLEYLLSPVRRVAAESVRER